LDGSHRRRIIADSGSVPHIFSLAIIDDDLYWTDWTYRGILRADKYTGANVTVVAQTALLPYAIRIFHPTVMQPECMVVVTCWVISIAFFSTKSM
jgi:hypothetical protein